MLCFENLKFRKSHVAKCGKIRRKCTKKTCSTKLYTHQWHNQESDNALERQIINNSIKRKAIEGHTICEKPSKLICREMERNSDLELYICRRHSAN